VQWDWGLDQNPLLCAQDKSATVLQALEEGWTLILLETVPYSWEGINPVLSTELTFKLNTGFQEERGTSNKDVRETERERERERERPALA
jgi:hypothetical protein